MRGCTLDEFAAKVEEYRPTFVYIAGLYSGLVDSIKGAIGPVTLEGNLRLLLEQPKSYSATAQCAIHIRYCHAVICIPMQLVLLLFCCWLLWL